MRRIVRPCRLSEHGKHQRVQESQRVNIDLADALVVFSALEVNNWVEAHGTWMKLGGDYGSHGLIRTYLRLPLSYVYPFHQQP